MLFSENWLRDIVNPDLDTQALADRLTMAGLEVEDLTTVAPPFTGVVVAQILSAEKHPDADRLRVCRVNAGGEEPLQIVCGAPNAAEGIKIPLATMGAVLPGGFKIKEGKLRGVKSYGMLCSAKELGLVEEADGLLVLPEDAPVGTDIREYLDLDEAIFEVKLTPNKADCLSVYGVAREVAALTGAPLKTFDFTPAPVTIEDTLPVEVVAKDLCGRFAGRVIRGVDASVPTPEWMVKRLNRAGQKSISILVDISNYVMLELGRPTHCFDLDKVSSGLEVRWANKGEKLTCLNEMEVALDERFGVVASNGLPQSIAGVMGGLDSGITVDTKDIFLEGAFWFPDAIAGRTRWLKFGSDAAHRFERGVDFEMIPEHLEYMTKMILDLCGGQAGPLEMQTFDLPVRPDVTMRLSRCQKILGVEVSQLEVASIFSQLGLSASFTNEVFTVKVPSYRFDLEIEEDLIEEVARIYGFDRIPERPPVSTVAPLRTHETKRHPMKLRHRLASLDYQELVNYSFVDPSWEADNDPIKLMNPIASALSVMRTSLIPGLLNAVVFNANRKQNRVRVFELGRVFCKNSETPAGDLTVKGIDQPLRLSGVAWGLAQAEQWGLPSRAVDFFDVKQDIMNLLPDVADQLTFVASDDFHPGRTATIMLKGRKIGVMGELHPKQVQTLKLDSAPIVFELYLDVLQDCLLPKLQQISKLPPVVRDLAIWAKNDLSIQEIKDTILGFVRRDKSSIAIRDVLLFDVWKDPENTQERSLAFHFVFQPLDQTLEAAQINDFMNNLLAYLVDTLGVRQR